MKKGIFILFLLILILLMVSCQAQVELIHKLNSKAKSTTNFTSVSLFKSSKMKQGRLLIRKENKILYITIFFSEEIPSFNNYNQMKSLIRTVQYKLLNFNQGSVLMRTINYKNDKEKKSIRNFDVEIEQAEKKLAWGEKSFWGVNIQREKLNLIKRSEAKKNKTHWKKIKANYNLSNNIKSVVGHKGIFKLWYNSKNSVVELYKQKEEQMIVLRRTWLNVVPKLSLQKKNKERWLKVFLHYYNKAKFKSFVGKKTLKKWRADFKK